MRVRALAKEVIYNAASKVGLTHLARVRLRGQAVILTYHSFTANDDRHEILNAMPIRRFERQLAFLRRYYEIISLSEMLRFIQEQSSRAIKTSKPRVAITVDDGFVDNYTLMFPLARKYGIPLTVFVATDFLDTGRPPWPTRIAEMLKVTSVPVLQYPISMDLCDYEAKVKAKYAIIDLWKHLDPQGRSASLNELREHLRVPVVSRVQPLTWDQVREMRKFSVEFGSHTVYHSMTPFVSTTTVLQELRDSKRRLEDELNKACTLFAYPNGNWDEVTRCLVQEEGYLGAVTQDRGSNAPGADPYCLKRVEVPYDETLGTFACRSSLLAW
jgi:peptidoglycan/xylan/chitin deacetylase (PgdA/CDA1 family)